jgi:hypothetical protein
MQCATTLAHQDPVIKYANSTIVMGSAYSQIFSRYEQFLVIRTCSSLLLLYVENDLCIFANTMLSLPYNSARLSHKLPIMLRSSWRPSRGNLLLASARNTGRYEAYSWGNTLPERCSRSTCHANFNRFESSAKKHVRAIECTEREPKRTVTPNVLM